MFDDNKKDYWEKSSWRDRDAKNNQSPHAIKDQKPTNVKSSSVQKRNESLAKKDLDELFKPKVNKEETKAWTSVMQSSASSFSKVAGEFVEKFGYPKDWNDQIKLLEHNEVAFVEKLLDHMKENLSVQTPTKRELFQGKLKVLLASCDDYSLSKTIQGLLSSEFPS